MQNAKNAGSYRKALSIDRLPAARGVVRDAQSISCGKVINEILCHGKAPLPEKLSEAQYERLGDFVRRGLVSTANGMVRLKPGATPYTRAIAATFDPRLTHQPGRFSAAV